jgi:hypothetical protein
MAKIQISFQDNSDNEDQFRIYRGTATPVTTNDTQIAQLDHDGTSWSISGPVTNLEISQGVNNSPSSTGDQYIVLYDETSAGDYYYGVLASNAVGDSAISTSDLVQVTA